VNASPMAEREPIPDENPRNLSEDQCAVFADCPDTSW
jgi:hypothetical protein